MQKYVRPPRAGMVNIKTGVSSSAAFGEAPRPGVASSPVFRLGLARGQLQPLFTHESLKSIVKWDAGAYVLSLMMTTAAHIRPATAADLPALTDLGLALARQHYTYDPRRYDLFAGVADLASDFPAQQRAYLARQFGRPEAAVLVAEQAGVVVGYAYGGLEPASFELGLREAGWIHDILVRDDAQGSGAGRQLLAALVAALRERGAQAILLHAAVQNEKAQHVFERYGFRPTMLEMRLDF